MDSKFANAGRSVAYGSEPPLEFNPYASMQCVRRPSSTSAGTVRGIDVRCARSQGDGAVRRHQAVGLPPPQPARRHGEARRARAGAQALRRAVRVSLELRQLHRGAGSRRRAGSPGGLRPPPCALRAPQHALQVRDCPEERWREAFDRADRDGSSCISRSEVAEVISAALGRPAGADEVCAFMAHFDKNGVSERGARRRATAPAPDVVGAHSPAAGREDQLGGVPRRAGGHPGAHATPGSHARVEALGAGACAAGSTRRYGADGAAPHTRCSRG